MLISRHLPALFAALLPVTTAPVQPTAPLPWNATGHRLVALVAWSQMSPQARKGAVELLRQHPRFDKGFAAQMPAFVQDDDELAAKWIFMHAATWPDIARGFRE